MQELISLPITRLHPHPDNPRKDLGDLTELTDSIKVNGIHQNLTVVPDTPIPTTPLSSATGGWPVPRWRDWQKCPAWWLP